MLGVKTGISGCHGVCVRDSGLQYTAPNMQLADILVRDKRIEARWCTGGNVRHFYVTPLGLSAMIIYEAIKAAG